MAEAQTISQRANAQPPLQSEMPEHERSLTEEFRITANLWADADAAAFLMLESKTAVLSQMAMKLLDVPNGEKVPSVASAEMKTRASNEWFDHLTKMAAARRKANLIKVRLDWIKMRERECDRSHWNGRTERTMGRSVT